jgi:hypothetical protein
VKRLLNLSIFRNPFDHTKDRENRQLEIIPGAVIENYLTTCLIPDDWQVYYSSAVRNLGKVLEPEEIEIMVPLDGDGLVIMPAIKGGGDDGGKNILSAVASIGLMMFSYGIGNLAAGAGFQMTLNTAGWGFWSYAAAVGVQFAGGYLVSQMTPTPKIPELQTESPTYGWQIQSTQGEGNAIPVTFGTVRTGGQLLNAHVTFDGEKQYLNLLYSGGEGPCKYTGNGEYNHSDMTDNVPGIDKILINGNPASNYTNLEICKRAGLNNQSVIPNFNDTFAEENIATELVLGSDWTIKTTISTAAQGLEVVIQLPALFKAGKNGQLETASVQIQIDFKLHSASEWTTLDAPTIAAATGKPVYRVYRVDNVDMGQYDVRCKCLSKSGADATYSNVVNWYTLSAINYEDFQRPNQILLAIKALATDQLSGGMPTVTWEQTRSKGWVWNSNTSQYVEKSLTTPAWACYDLISRIKKYENIHTREMETVAEGVAVNRMDYEAFNEAAAYQEEIVNGRQRCRCNYILDETKTLWDALKDLEAVGRFKVIPRGTKYSCVVDRPITTPVWMANAANTILDSFSEQFSDTAKRANSVEVRFRNQDNNYDWDTVVVNADDYDDAATVPNPILVTLAACTDWDHAHMEGAYLLRQNQLLTRTITTSHDIDAIGVQIGDVYYFQSDVTDWGQGGRIVAADADSVSIDRQVYLAAGKTYQIIVRMADETIEKREVQFAEAGYTSRLTVTEPFATVPQPDAMYSFGETSIAAKPFRVISITRDGDLRRKITGIEYVEALYEELADIPIPQYSSQSSVTGITATGRVDSTGIIWLDISWMPPKNTYNGARIEVNGKLAGTAKGFETSYSAPVESVGTYKITVVTIDLFGNDAGSASKSVTITGSELYPPDVTEVALDEDTFILRDGTALSDIAVSFAIPDDRSFIKHFNIYYDIDNSGVWRFAGNTPVTRYKIKSLPNTHSVKVKVTTVSKFDLESSGVVSDDFTLTGKSAPPSDVSSLTAVQNEYNRAEIVLSWPALDVVANPDVRGYEVRVGDSGWDAATKVKPDTIVGTATTYTATANGHYQFYVKAIDNSGNYSLNSAVVEITVIIVPDAPTGLTAVQDEKDRSQLIITWAASPGKDIAAYQLKYSPGNWDAGTDIAETKETTYKWTIPASGTYPIMVRAVTTAGNVSNIANVSVSPMIEPEDVTGFTAVQSESNRTRITLSWDAPIKLDIAYYVIKKGASWDSATMLGSHVAGVFYDTTVTEEAAQTFWIKAVSAAGKESRNPARVSGVYSLNPSPVTVIQARQSINDKSVLNIMWAGVGEGDLRGYQVKIGDEWEVAEELPETKELYTTYHLTGTGNYKIMIKTVNAAGFYSDEASIMYYAKVEPADATGFVAYQNGDRVQLYWDQSSELDVTSYEIREGATFDQGRLVAAGVTQPSFDEPVDSERVYRYFVKAINRAGFYSLNAASVSVQVINLPVKNVIASYDQIALQSGIHNNTEFGQSLINWSNMGGRWPDYPTTKFSDVGGATVLKLKQRNFYSNPKMDVTTGWSSFNGSTLAVLTSSPGGSFPSGVTKCMSATVISGQTYGGMFQYFTLLKSTTYTVTLWVYISSAVPANKVRLIGFYNGFNNASYTWITERDQWVKKSLTFTTSDTYTDYKIGISMGSVEAGSIVYACLAQLEFGDIATDFGSYFPSGTYTLAQIDVGQIITANITAQFVSTVILKGSGSAILQMQTSQDGSNWTNWATFKPVQYTFRYAEFRVLLGTEDITKTPEVNQFVIKIDVPDTDIAKTATIATGGTTVAYGHTYYTVPIVTPTAIGEGLHPELISKTQSNCVVKIKNVSNVDVGGQADIRVKGY